VNPIDSCLFLQSKKIFFTHAARAGYFFMDRSGILWCGGNSAKMDSKGLTRENLKQDYVDPGSNEILFP